MSEWQPIETAPKDGSTIMAWSRYLLEPVTVRWSARPGKTWESCWEGSEVIDVQSDFGTDYKDPNPLTHWCPMPGPPPVEP